MSLSFLYGYKCWLDVLAMHILVRQHFTLASIHARMFNMYVSLNSQLRSTHTRSLSSRIAKGPHGLATLCMYVRQRRFHNFECCFVTL